MSLPFPTTATPEPARNGLGRTVRRRVADFFLLPPESRDDAPADGHWLPPAAVDDPGADPRRPLRTAAVLGAREDVPPVAAAVANALAARRGARAGRPTPPAWLGDGERRRSAGTSPPAAMPTGVAVRGAPLVACWSPVSGTADKGGAAVTGHQDAEAAPPALPGARRLAATLEAAGTPAVARGRVAWVALPADPEHVAAAWTAARDRAGHERAAVLALAGPRLQDFDDHVAGQDLVVLVISEGEAALEALARGSLEERGATVVAVPPMTGAARLLALAGLGRLQLALETSPGLESTRTPA